MRFSQACMAPNCTGSSTHVLDTGEELRMCGKAYGYLVKLISFVSSNCSDSIKPAIFDVGHNFLFW